MKITKRQLKRIIKEEKAKLLRESFEFGSFEERVRDLHSNISSAAEETYTGFDYEDLKTFEELMDLAGISRPEEGEVA